MKKELLELFQKICAGEELRASLIELKNMCKKPENRQIFDEVCTGNYDVIMKCLVQNDPKIRKNAAALLGELGVQEAADVLMDAYEAEETLFVRPEYVDALAKLDCAEYVPQFHKRLEQLQAYDAPENEKKHVNEEIRALRELLLAKEGLKKHTFTGFYRANEVVLTTMPAFRDALAGSVTGKKTVLRGGIRMVTGDMEELLQNRLWQELLFVLHETGQDVAEIPFGSKLKPCGKLSEAGSSSPDGMQEKDDSAKRIFDEKCRRTDDAQPLSSESNQNAGFTTIKRRGNNQISATSFSELADCLQRSDLLEILRANHSGEPPFYFRVGVQGLPRGESGAFTKKAAQMVEAAFRGELVNSASHYEAELRLIVRKDGGIVPFLKLFTLPDRRFAYRKYSLAAGMKPSLAAGLMALARPYLKEYAQVLDPFCGVGTLLVERSRALPTRNLYGIDMFGEAIMKARANTRLARLQANYVNRNFFDFTHAYPFDEIVTDMPSGADREETDRIYRKFFEKSAALLGARGRIVLYSGEMGLVKKYLRLQNAFRLLKEWCISEKNGMYLFVLEAKK